LSGPVVIPNKASLIQKLVGGVVCGLLRLLRFTWRINFSDPHGVIKDSRDKPFILCVWHNRLVFGMDAYSNNIKPISGRRLAAMVSASKDGALLVEVLKAFDIEPVRGSTSRRGRQALLELSRKMKAGMHLGITPDGPRGPCYEIQDGILALSQVTGLPIIPLGASANRKYRFNSWDRFQLPMPFARCDVAYGAPLQVPRELDDTQRAAIRAELKSRMDEINPE
tara:strand:- start:931 stop:1602 length:672 start_codon:yes stop_codon:yes gene_type:complete